MFFVYAIRNSSNGKIYIGYTENLTNRLNRHNGVLKTSKKSFTSKNKNDGEWLIVYREIYNDRKEAIKREKELKTQKGREFIKILT